jgi:hypothetical protein
MATPDIEVIRTRAREASRLKPEVLCNGIITTPNLWAFIDERKFFTRLTHLFYFKSIPTASISDKITVSNLYSGFFRNAIYNDGERTNYPVLDIGIRIDSCDYKPSTRNDYMNTGGLYLSCSMVYTKDKYIKSISEQHKFKCIKDLHISVHLLPGGRSQSHIKCLIDSSEICENIFFYLNNDKVNICNIPLIANELAEKANRISPQLSNEMEIKGGIISIQIGREFLQNREKTKILMRNAFVQLLISFEKFLNHLRDSNVPILNINREIIVDETDSKKTPQTEDDYHYAMDPSVINIRRRNYINYQKKYLKYKQKYLELKNKHQL